MKRKVIKFIDSCITNEQTDVIATPETIVATGFVIAETNEYITLAREIIGDNDYCGQLSIPKVAIIKRLEGGEVKWKSK